MNNKRTTASLLTLHSSSTYLPARIVAGCMEFALDAKDIARSQSVCRGWRLPANLLDKLFHTRYLQQFEARTANTPEIAREGAATTPWKTRYRRRHQVRRNWESGRYKTSTVELSHSGGVGFPAFLIVPETNLLLFWRPHTYLALICTTDGRVMAHSTVTIDPYYTKQVATNGRSVFCIPGTQNDNTIVELSLPDLQLVHSYPFPRFVSKISVDDKILVGIRAIGGHQHSEVHVFNTEQKQLLYIIAFEQPSGTALMDCALDVASNSLLLTVESSTQEFIHIDRYDLGDGKKQISEPVPCFEPMIMCHKHGCFMNSVMRDVTTLEPSFDARDDRTQSFTMQLTDDHICQYWYHPRHEIAIHSVSGTDVRFPSINLTGLAGFTGYEGRGCLQCDAFRVLLYRNGVLHVFDFASVNLD